MLSRVLTVLTKDPVWEAEFAGASVGVASAVAGVDLVTAGGLRGPRPVVPERRPEGAGDEAAKVSEEAKLGLGQAQVPQDQQQGEELHVLNSGEQ